MPYLIAYIQVIPINQTCSSIVSSFKLGSGQVIFTTFGSYAPFNILIAHQSRTVIIFLFCSSVVISVCNIFLLETALDVQ